MVLDLTQVVLKRLHLTPPDLHKANMELVYQITDDQGRRFGTTFPMFSAEPLTTLLARSPLKCNDGTRVLAVSIFCHDNNVFQKIRPMSIAWKPPSTFKYGVPPKEHVVRLVHGATGYELLTKTPPTSRGVDLKLLIRQLCLCACASDLVAADPSLPALVPDARLELLIGKDGKTLAGTYFAQCVLLDAWPVAAAMLMLTGDPTFHCDIVVTYVIAPSSRPLMRPILDLPCLRSWETNIPVLAKLVMKKDTDQFITAFLRAVEDTPLDDRRRTKLMYYIDNLHYHYAAMPDMPFLDAMRMASQ